MKKNLLLFLIAVLVVSCNNDSSKDIKLNSVDLKANASDWVTSADQTGIYSVHFNMPEITQGVFDSGEVTTYIVLDGNPTTQEPLPYVRHYQDTDGTLWTQTIDFDYAPGGINVYVTNSNFANNPPPTYSFRTVIM